METTTNHGSTPPPSKQFSPNRPVLPYKNPTRPSPTPLSSLSDSTSSPLRTPPSSSSRPSSYFPTEVPQDRTTNQYLQPSPLLTSSSPSTSFNNSYPSPSPRSRPTSYMGSSPSLVGGVGGGGGVGGQYSPALSTHSNNSNYSTGGTKLQAKSAIAERTTREDLKSLRDVFDMGPEEFNTSISGSNGGGGGGMKSSSSSLNGDKINGGGGERGGNKKEGKWSIKDLKLGPTGFGVRSTTSSNNTKSSTDHSHSHSHSDDDSSTTSSILSINNLNSNSNNLPPLIFKPQISKPPTLQSRQEKSRRETERESVRRRRPEALEWSQTCWVWEREGASVVGKEFSMLGNENSNNSKRKLSPSKRESTQFPSVSILPHNESPSPIFMGEGKSPFEIGPDSSCKDGYWRATMGVLKDDGYLRIYSDEKKVVLHSIHLPSTPRTDISSVDFSLFGRPNCLVIHRHSSSPIPSHHSTNHSTSNLSNSNHSSRPTSYSSNFSPSSQRSTTKEDSSSSSSSTLPLPVYLCFPSIVAMQTWKIKLLCFSKPNFLDSGVLGIEDLHPFILMKKSLHGYSDDDYDDEEEEEEDEESNYGDELSKGGGKISEGRCRMFRSITVVINEGRGIGELGSEIIRATPISTLERERRTNSERSHSPSIHNSNTNSGAWSSAENLNHHSNESTSLSKSTSTSSIPNSRVQPRGAAIGGSLRDHLDSSSNGNNSGGSVTGLDTFCEVLLEGEVVGRTSIKKGTTSPYWNETFDLASLPPIIKPLTISILEMNKNPTKPPTLLGTAIVRIPDLPRSETIEDWWCVKPISYDVTKGKASDTLGELSLKVLINEEVVLPKAEYQGLLDVLSDDPDAELAIELSQEFSQSLEEVTKILLRIYQASNLLLPRILRLAEYEIDGDSKSSAILFRGNSILTKSVELYLRLVGKDFLEASIGGVVRRLVEGKVEIEIDPAKLKVGTKEKEIAANIKELKEWCSEIWKEIYNARERCPNELRQIFFHIQHLVTRKYGDENPNMKSTSIGAFIFLRFFVPAILNPKLFNLVPVTPSTSSQRTLTLIAKTLQGLANFSSFGIKEVWMGSLNEFLKENQESYVDFIKHISTPLNNLNTSSSSNSGKILPDQWTSSTSAIYFATTRIKAGLSSSGKEGIPILPHLLDLPRDLGLLANLVAKNHLQKLTTMTPSTGSPQLNGDLSSFTSTSLSRASTINSTGAPSYLNNRSPKYQELISKSVEIYEETRRRGAGVLGAVIGSNGSNLVNNLNGSIGKGGGGRSNTSFNASGSASIGGRSRSGTTTSLSSFSPSSTASQSPLTPLTPERGGESSSSSRNIESPPSSLGSRRSTNRNFKIGRDLFPDSLQVFDEIPQGGFKEEED